MTHSFARHRLAQFVCAAAVATACTTAPALASPSSVATRVPAALASHPLRMAAGGTRTWSPANGEVTVLHFWASWCAPCRRELPRIAALERSLAATGGRVLAVSIDQDIRNAVRFADRVAPGLTVYHDGSEGLARTLDLPALPWTVVLGRDGAVVWSGGGSDDATFEAMSGTARRLASTRAIATETTEGSPR